MTRLVLRLFGGFEVMLDGAPVTLFEYDKVRALLAYLALEPPVLRDREALAGLLWPEQPAEDARQSLRQALYRLRAALADDATPEPLVLATRTGVQRNPAADFYCDALAFDAQLAARPQSIEHLEAAADLYRGELLQGLTLAGTVGFEDWLLLRREEYARLALETLEQLARRKLQQGDYVGALVHAQRQVALAPWREEAHRLTMDLLARAGRRSEALLQYERCRRALRAELGVEPDLTTRRLYLQIKAPLHRHVPAKGTPFVGRSEELAQLAMLLADPACRLVTVAGLGGMGKTRLALTAATHALDENDVRFMNGVAFVPLAGLDHPRQAVPAIAGSLNFSFAGPEPEQAQLLGYLRDQELLLVLDNFEQLIGPEARALLQALLDAGPGVKLLVTSREPVEAHAEHVLLLDGLPIRHAPASAGRTPGAAGSGGAQHGPGDAVRLFLDAAGRAGARLALTAAELAAVERICTLVGGMPLAIELAAGWSTTLSPAEIAGELVGCLDLLSRDGRSLLAVFDATWGRLSARQRLVLGMLSVFRNGFSRDAAEAVVQAAPRDLLGLVERSLLRRSDDGRYGMHEMLREYALERLQTDPAASLEARDRHAAYFMEFVTGRAERLRVYDTLAAADEIGAEIENVRVAWLWAAERGRSDWIEHAAMGVHFYHELRSEYAEAERLWLAAERHLQDGGPAQEALAQVLAAHAATAARWDAPERVQQLAEQCLALQAPEIEPGYSAGLALLVLGNMARQTGRNQEADARYKEAAAIAQRIQDPPLLTVLPEVMGLAAMQRGDLAVSKQLLLESLRLGRVSRNPWHEMFALANLAELAHLEGDVGEALRLAKEADRISAVVGNRYLRTGALMLAARSERKLGALAGARRALAEGLGIAVSDADRLALLGELSSLLHAEGQDGMAREMMEFVLAHPALRPEDLPWIEQQAAEMGVTPRAEARSAAAGAVAIGAPSRRLEDFVARYAE